MPIKPFMERIEQYVNLEKVKTVFDVGAGYGEESAEFAAKFESVHAFECNPACLVKLLEKTRDHKNLTVVAMAVVGPDGGVMIDFYPIDPLLTTTTHADGNPQASSMYVANGKYPHEQYVQQKMRVPAFTLNEYSYDEGALPQLLWMDLQGAELDALIGMDDLLDNIQAIHTEAELKPIYKNQALFPAINAYLEAKGFKEIHRENWSEYGIDVEYVRKELL